MRKIKVSVSTRKVGSKCEDIIEVEDDMDEDEITEIAQEVMFEMMEWDWVEIDE